MAPRLHNGDLIGFSGEGLVADVINVGSYGIPRWNLSHIGIICEYRGIHYLFESTTLNGDHPCAIKGVPVSGVQAHTIGDFLQRPGKIWHYPLRTRLYGHQSQRLRLLLLELLGREYDLKGAVRSGGCFLRILEKTFRMQDVSTLFCSEMDAFVLTNIGVAHIINASGQSPNSLVRRLYRNAVVEKRIRLK